MKKTIPLLLLSSALLTACGPDKLVYDLPSPSGKYHIEVRHCPETGSITWGEQLEVYILEAGVASRCHSVVESLVGFNAGSPGLRLDELQVEWVTDTQVRAWYPNAKPNELPTGLNSKYNSPVEIVFLPKP